MNAPSITVRQLYEKYEAATRAGKSWKTIEYRLRPVIAALGDREVMSLRVLDWSDYRAEREQKEIPTGKPGRRYKPHTLNLELQYFKTLLNFGVGQGRISHNPIATAKSVRTKSKRSTAPGEEDVTSLLAGADDRMRMIVLCATDAGMRRSEIVRLRREWIDRDRLRIRLPGWACKSGEPRTVPVTERMLDAIDALPRHLHSPYVLVNPDTGEPYSVDTISKIFRALADESGVQGAPGEKVVLHSLRHGYATNATRRGVRIEVVSGILGHASVDQTLDYVETDDIDVDAARETFEQGIANDKRRGPKRIETSPASDGNEKSKSGEK